MNVKDKVVLITGANRGIGRALVDEALRRGAKKVYAAVRKPQTFADERVTPLIMDVTSGSQILQAAGKIDTLDILINNAGVARYDDDLTDPDLIEQHLLVNLLGPFKVIKAVLPLLIRSQGAILNNLSLAGIGAVPFLPAYSISKAAAHSMTQLFGMFLAKQNVAVHAVILGPIDTDMTHGLEIPKTSPEAAAEGIFDGLEKGTEDIFPDMGSQPIEEAWRGGITKTLERQFAASYQ